MDLLSIIFSWWEMLEFLIFFFFFFKEWISSFLQGEAAFLILPTAEIYGPGGMFVAGALCKIQQILLKQTNSGILCVSV